MENNLFTYATNELSQDAFICWLASYAMADAKRDDGLKECAKAFLRECISASKSAIPDDIIVTEAPIKQYVSIDVLITVNRTFKIIIEDKTFSQEHDDQLQRYETTVQTDFPDCTICKIYFKIGFQSDLSQVENAGYTVLNRKRIIELLEPYVGMTQNQIFLDYFEYLNTYEQMSLQFRYLPVSVWQEQQIYAFYDDCKRSGRTKSTIGHVLSCNYGYVSNPAGGFYALWIYDNQYREVMGATCELYLQVEFISPELLIRLKTSIAADDYENGIASPKSIRDKLTWRESSPGKWNSLPEKFGFTKTTRLGSGKSMTLGTFNRQITSIADADEVIADAIDHYYEYLAEFDTQTIYLDSTDR